MKKVIINLITLSVTTCLLILTIFSWYVSNKEVSANGIVASTGSNKLYVSSNYSSSYSTYNSVSPYLSTFTNFNTDYWGYNATISSNALLLPSSTSDASTFYYTNESCLS